MKTIALGVVVFGVVAVFAQSPSPEAEIVVRPEAARVFPGRVQPILMNLCANCHCRNDHTSEFKLIRVSDEFATPTATTRNLRTAAMFVNAANPAMSPLLVKAITPHGGLRDAPLHGVEHPAYKSLELWVKWARPAPPVPVATAAPVFQSAPAPSPPMPMTLLASEPVPVSTPNPEPTPTKPNPHDPFDPEIFNRTER